MCQQRRTDHAAQLAINGHSCSAPASWLTAGSLLASREANLEAVGLLQRHKACIAACSMLLVWDGPSQVACRV